MASPRSAEMNTQAFDIAIRRARLRGSADRYADIGIKDGRIAAIAPRLDGGAATEIDAGGNLVTESFVNPHLHLCKVWTLPMMEEEALRAYQGEGMRRAFSTIHSSAYFSLILLASSMPESALPIPSP